MTAIVEIDGVLSACYFSYVIIQSLGVCDAKRLNKKKPMKKERIG
jgi:hypothetical protein